MPRMGPSRMAYFLLFEIESRCYQAACSGPNVGSEEESELQRIKAGSWGPSPCSGVYLINLM